MIRHYDSIEMLPIELLGFNKLKEATKVAYDTIALDYNQRTHDLDQFAGVKDDLEEFCESLGGDLVLDAGAGACRDTAFLIKKGLRVEAIDISQEMLTTGKQVCPTSIMRVMSVTDLAYRSRVFDGIWCNAVLLHLEEQSFVKALKEFHRVLSTDGVLYISIKKGEGVDIVREQSHANLYRAFFYYDVSTVLELLEDNNFHITRCSERTEVLQKYTNHWINVFAQKG